MGFVVVVHWSVRADTVASAGKLQAFSNFFLFFYSSRRRQRLLTDDVSERRLEEMWWSPVSPKFGRSKAGGAKERARLGLQWFERCARCSPPVTLAPCRSANSRCRSAVVRERLGITRWKSSRSAWVVCLVQSAGGERVDHALQVAFLEHLGILGLA